MILSTPFSRQNRSWTNSNTVQSTPNHHHKHHHHHRRQHNQTTSPVRKPAPHQPAPEQPAPAQHLHLAPAASNGLDSRSSGAMQPPTQSFRSHTLNRLDLLRARQQRNQQQPTGVASLRRNLSSLGHYPITSVHDQKQQHQQPYYANNHHEAAAAAATKSQTATNGQIYAPASVAASPGRDLAHYKQPAVAARPGELPTRLNNNGESAHYAATSYRGPAAPVADYHPIAASESGRSGRESAMGNLFGRFSETLRRHTKWAKSSRKGTTNRSHGVTSSSRADSTPPYVGDRPHVNGFGPPSSAHTMSRSQAAQPKHALQQPQPPPPPPLPPTLLEPEIYATGKKKVEAEEIYAEGLNAIDGNIQKRLLEHQLDESIMIEGETKTIIEAESRAKPEFQQLVGGLINWINDELAQQRIIVRDLQDDLYDGQILGKLVEKLHGVDMDVVEVTQNEAAQRFKLRTVLDKINRILQLQGARWAQIRWSVDGIHGKNLVEITHLLVTLARCYRAPLRLPANVRVRVLVVQKHQGRLVKRSHEAQLTDTTTTNNETDLAPTIGDTSSAGGNGTTRARQKDAFDTLLEFAPDKLELVKTSLCKFVNRHLNKINISCLKQTTAAGQFQAETLDPEQFSDGLLLVFLIASLEEYFVPLGNLFTSAIPHSAAINSFGLGGLANGLDNHHTQTALEPDNYTNTQPIQKLHNVNVALQLMEEAGLDVRQRVRAEDIVNGDLKSVLRVLYALFSRYKHV